MAGIPTYNVMLLGESGSRISASQLDVNSASFAYSSNVANTAVYAATAGGSGNSAHALTADFAQTANQGNNSLLLNGKSEGNLNANSATAALTANVANSVTGSANLSATLQVAGASILNGLTTANAGLVVNGTVSFNNTVSANGGIGSVLQVLTSAGVGANAYWRTPSTGPPDANTTVGGLINITAQTLAGDKTWNGNTTANNLTVAGASVLNGLLTANAGLVVNGTVQLNNTFTANGSVGAIGQILLTGGAGQNVYWGALSTLTLANTTVNGWVNISSTLQVGGAANVGSSLTVGGYANVAGQLFVTGITSNAAVAVSGTVAAGNTTVTGFVNVSSTLQVAGLSTLSGNASFSGYVNIASTLQVTGATIVNGLTTANAGLTVNGATIINSTLSANGSVGTATQVLTSQGANAYWAAIGAQVIANTTANGAVSTIAQSFAGVKTFTANTECSGYVNVATTMQVAGATIHNGLLTANASLVVNGSITVTGNVSTASGTWVPTDGSGAGLTLTITSATYLKIGRLVHLQCYFTMPATASGLAATMTGLPFAPATNYDVVSIGSSTYASPMTGYLTTAPAISWVAVGGGNLTNANLSGKAIIFSCTYIT